MKETEPLTGQVYSSGKVWTYGLIITLSSFYYGYQISAFNTSQDTVSGALHWDSDKTLYISMYSAAFPLGALFSTPFAGWTANAIGRRRTLMLTAVVGIGVSILNAIPNTWTFGLGRLLSGAISGYMTAIPPLFLNEISPSAVSGRIGTLVQIQITFAIIVPALFALPLPTGDYENSKATDIWMFIFGFPVVFLALQILLFMCVAKHESPTWLIMKGRKEDALKFYEHIYPDKDTARDAMTAAEDRVRPVVKEMHKDDSIRSPDASNTVYSHKAFFTQKKFRWMLHLSIMIMLLQQWSGVNAIFSYSSTMFSFSTFMGRVFALILDVVNFLATCLAIFFVDKQGRKPLLVFGTLGCSLFLAATGFTSLFNQSYISIVMVIGFIVCFEMSLGPVIWVFAGETLYDGAMSVSVETNWLCFFILLVVFPFLDEIGIYVCFWAFAAICGFGVLYFSTSLIETKGKSKEENQRKLLGEQ